MPFDGGEWRKEIKMNAYKIEKSGDVLKVGFGSPAQNDQIVKDAEARLDEMVNSGELAGGEVIRVSGPASLPVAMVLAHKLAHLYQAVACFDPKLSKYVVAIVHGDKYAVGDLVE
jgi:CRISPR-associated protein Csx3